jgi:predicted NACHT family NTPase
VVLTCRVNVWDASINALQGFDSYRTLELSYGDGNKPDQIREFISQWFSNTDKPELGEKLREKLDGRQTSAHPGFSQKPTTVVVAVSKLVFLSSKFAEN